MLQKKSTTISTAGLSQTVKNDPLDQCLAYFSRNLQARLTRDDIEKNLPQLKKIAQHLGLKDESDLFQHVHDGHSKTISAVESFLLRPHPELFDGPGMYKTFETILLPQLMTQNVGSKKISFWIPGCGRGLEAYSLALVLFAHKKELAEWTVSIHATDTDAPSLDQAEKGLCESPLLDSLFSQLYGNGLKRVDDTYILRKEVRALIHFQHSPFLDTQQNHGSHQVIIFRDHLKHWEPALQEKIISHFESSLTPHGYLILGYGESLLGLNNQFKFFTTVPGFYQRRHTTRHF